jgi:hypothetical protein
MQTAVRPSRADLILEEADQAELIQIREWDCLMRFRVGDIANKYALRSAGRGLPVPDTAIHEAVGRFCGKTGRTVRYYAEQAAFYPADVRATYNEVPFSVFVLARRCGPAWRDVLDYALAHPLASEAEIEREFLHRPLVVSPALDEPLSDVRPSDGRATYTAAAPVGFVAHQLVRAASDLLSVVEKISQAAELPPGVTEHLSAGCEALRRALAQLGAGLDP